MPEPLPGRRGALPWGPRHVLIGALAGAAVFAVAVLLVEAVIGASGEPRDAGDAFVKAGEIAAYADKRLAATAAGEDPPAAPALFRSPATLTVIMIIALALQLGFAGAVAGVTGLRPGRLAHRLGLTRFSVRGLWRPALAVVGCYAMIAAYGAIVDALGIGALQPESTVPPEFVDHLLPLILTGVGVVAVAPLTEEVFYRGLVFGGLQRWGFWPAALISGAVFSAAHLDTGSFIPFFIIGVTLAWLFWRRGELWESVAFHALFNAISFSILLATEA